PPPIPPWLASTDPRYVAMAMALPKDAPIGGSAVVGYPGFKVFRAPDSYEIIGLNVSSYDGNIDWLQVAQIPKMQFAYIRATSRIKDKNFDSNWTGAKRAGLKRGGYHVFDFAKSATEQFELIRKSIPRDEEALPFGIDPEMFSTARLSEDKRKAAGIELLKLKQLCSEYFAKPVVLYGAGKFFAEFPESVAAGDSIWLARYVQKGPAAGFTPPHLPGNEPWTIWQFAGEAKVQGVPHGADLNAFFGTAAEFHAFARGERGVASRQTFLSGRMPFEE
ncbi:MAG: lysozyme, partial [Chthoniobacter sp.]|nr:lysozyme [Chthoniobacter sp.]